MEKQNVPPLQTPNGAAVATAVPLRKESAHEAFLGSLLVFILVILLLGIIGFFGFLGYRVYKQSQIVRSTPSIERLSAEKTIPIAATEPQSAEAAAPVATSPTASAPTVEIKKADLQVKVLNGGAAKGVAGTFGETLKKAGYTKVTVGNSIGDFTGASIYSAKGKAAEAEVLKADVAKEYPKVTTQEAPAADKDANAATFVVTLGK